MRFNRVLLVQAKYDSTFSNVLPLGIGYLAEFLKSRGIQHEVFDLNVSKNIEKRLHEKISIFKPDLIGFSMMSLNCRYNYNVTKRLKEASPNLKVAAGGAHISTMREEVLKDCPAIDYGVVLEGEYTLLELILGEKGLSHIKGLIYRESEEIVYNGDRPFIQDLDSLPYPKYEKFNKKDYSIQISIFSSRGCPFECVYCPTKLAIGRRFTARSPKNVVDEMEYHYRHGYRDFSFRDDNFTLIQGRVYEICDEIEKRHFKDIYLICDSGVRADKINYKLLKRMKEVGFKMIAIGVESGDDRILKNLKKNATVKIMDDAIRTACELDYIVELFLLIGSPGETWQDFEKTVHLVNKYPVMKASFYHILPYPNTELFELAKKNNYLLKSPEEYLNDGSQRRNTPFLSTPEFPYELRKKAFTYAYKVTSRFIKNARRNYYRKNALEKFERMGFNHTLASFFAALYSIDLFHDYIFNNRFIVALKDVVKKRSMAKG